MLTQQLNKQNKNIQKIETQGKLCKNNNEEDQTKLLRITLKTKSKSTPFIQLTTSYFEGQFPIKFRSVS